tara:strand:- start:164 stop:352 length:189 start_codon:yes stop_codon:yes gene_type:complete
MTKIKKNEATTVASPRSRKAGQIEQDKMTAQITQLAGRLFSKDLVQVEVEPILKNLDKKKLN